LAGMTGEEVFERIQAKFGRVPPTIVLSAAQEGASRASAMPGAWFLAKPYTIEQLTAILTEAVASRGAA
jgi:DNA-binding response OmpR family regulator